MIFTYVAELAEFRPHRVSCILTTIATEMRKKFNVPVSPGMPYVKES